MRQEARLKCKMSIISMSFIFISVNSRKTTIKDNFPSIRNNNYFPAFFSLFSTKEAMQIRNFFTYEENFFQCWTKLKCWDVQLNFCQREKRFFFLNNQKMAKDDSGTIIINIDYSLCSLSTEAKRARWWKLQFLATISIFKRHSSIFLSLNFHAFSRPSNSQILLNADCFELKINDDIVCEL